MGLGDSGGDAGVVGSVGWAGGIIGGMLGLGAVGWDGGVIGGMVGFWGAVGWDDGVIGSVKWDEGL